MSDGRTRTLLRLGARQAQGTQGVAPADGHGLEAVGSRGHRWVVAVTAIIALGSGCGGPDPTIEAGSTGSGSQASTTPTSSDRPTSGCEANPADDPGSGSAILGQAAPEGYDVIDQQAQTVPRGETATFPVNFDGASAALLWILPGVDGISASMDGAEFSREDLLGAPVVTAAITSPHDGELFVRNETGDAENIGVIVFGLTTRRLTIDASPSEVAPNGEVAVTVRLGEATAADAPCAVVTRDGEFVTTLLLQPNGIGTWNSSFRPPTIGDYALQAAVRGDRPRHSELALVAVRAEARGEAPTSLPAWKRD